MCLLAICMLFLTACTDTAVSTAPELRVGISPHYPPLVYRDNGKLAGIDVDAAQLLAKKLNRKLVFVEKPFTDLIPALQTGNIDIIMSGLSITPARSQQVLFTNPYLDAGQVIMLRVNDASRLGHKDAIFLPRAKIAVVTGSTGATFARKHLSFANITQCNSATQAVDKLQKGNVDFLIHDAPTSWALASDKTKQDIISLNLRLTEEHLAWAIAKNQTALFNSVNAQLKIMKQSGEMNAIIHKWLPVTIEIPQKPQQTEGPQER